ncbi:MAG: radical SAM protein [Campylobacterota bacterium]|nr:radical SAM protein [Campylobacterota bacterium]
MSEILLVGINARYTHSAIGLRYLKANLKELQKDAEILEFVIGENAQSIAEQILLKEPEIVGIGVYIWNAIDVKNVIEVIKKVSPSTKIILGGPEVSHQPFRVDFSDSDYIVQGEGEESFYELCKDILDGVAISNRVIPAKIPKLKELQLPYELYTQSDIDNRYIYVEASRGCPFECEFCLSAIDERVRLFDIEKVLSSFETLWSRGARDFKFIDRTFNLNIKIANQIIDFFLEKDEQYSLHFEVIPDNFPQRLKDKIKKFPTHSLQLEIGIQTLNSDILHNINRVMDLKKVQENIKFLEDETNAHMHLDLIVGLPGETLESFAINLNRLKKMTNSEIQIGILKKLSGTTLSRHDEQHKMLYSNIPPYDILSNKDLSFIQIQKMKRFARFWDLLHNSGNFYSSISLLYKDGDVFRGFYDFSEWIFKQTASTWKISLNRMSELLFNYLVDVLKEDKNEVAEAILQDIIKVGGRSIPAHITKNAISDTKLNRTANSKKRKRQELRKN